MVALLIDISAKQDFIFSSTKLKDNIGASHIISRKVFADELLEEIGLYKEVLYEGGGELCLLFENQDCRSFIEQYSLKILNEFPGVKLNFGKIENFDSAHSWQVQKKALIRNSAKIRSHHHVNCRPLKPGIVADCSITGNHQEKAIKEGGVSKYVAKEVIVKRDAEKQSANILEENSSVIPPGFALTAEIEKLNIDDTHGYVAVVHIDGNGLGQRFKKLDSLNDYRELSGKVNGRIETALNIILRDTANLFMEGGPFDQSLDDARIRIAKAENGDLILPIRPIINAGDDITFVCHGKLGLHLALEYMQALRMKPINDEIINSSAGVAIVNKKFPFAKAYKLADELASEAKKKGRALGDKYGKWNWINFFISPEGYTGDFDELKARHFGKISRGPYFINTDVNQQLDGVISFDDLLQRLHSMAHSEEKWSRNKLIELRETLIKDEDEQELFKLHMEMRGKELSYPMNRFPYKDLVNMIDFYPLELLETCVTTSV